MQRLGIPKLLIATSVLMIGALVVLVYTNIVSLENLVALLKQAAPLWLLVAAAAQVATYVVLAFIWLVIGLHGGVRVPLLGLVRLALGKFSIDQLLHVGGLAGRLAALSIMQGMGWPPGLAFEVLVMDSISYYGSFAILALGMLALLVFHYQSTALLPILLAIFAAVVLLIVLGIWWLVAHRDWQAPSWIVRFAAIRELLGGFRGISRERMLSVRLISATTALQLVIMLLDAGTLWLVLHSIGIGASLLTAFTSFALASIAGLVSLLPGGIGGFEVACTASLRFLGVPFEGAVAATLLLRGFTLWLPILPGFFLIHKDLLEARRTLQKGDNGVV